MSSPADERSSIKGQQNLREDLRCLGLVVPVVVVVVVVVAVVVVVVALVVVVVVVVVSD